MTDRTFAEEVRLPEPPIDEPGMNPDPLTGAPGAHPVGTGIGAVGGAAAGASIGAAAGPVGAAVGTVVGAVAGALAGRGAAEAVNPTDPATRSAAHPSPRVAETPQQPERASSHHGL
jgi:phage tail tape-measure protein